MLVRGTAQTVDATILHGCSECNRLLHHHASWPMQWPQRGTNPPNAGSNSSKQLATASMSCQQLEASHNCCDYGYVITAMQVAC